MPNAHHPTENPGRGLAAPVATALAVKVIALAILYFAFFVPPAAPSPERAAAAVLGLAPR